MEDIQSTSIMHADESGFYINGKRNWIHSYSTKDSTYYAHHEKRGGKAMQDIGMLENYEGRCIHDHWDSYFGFNCLHGLCNSHHLRELKFLYDVKKEEWAQKMKDCLIAIKESVEYFRKKNRLPEKLVRYYTGRYRRTLRQGLDYHGSLPPLNKKGARGRNAQRAGKNMLDRLKSKEENVLAFMEDFNVPFDNNLGEREIRMIKVKQKISGCFRSPSGGSYFCRIRSFISTLRKRNLDVFEGLSDTFFGFAPV
jgi:transposase